jgi:signal peptidase I
MEPTLWNQDLLISTKFDFHLHPPQRGDIVILTDPYDAQQDFIKRVVGVPGDTLTIEDAKVYINGKVLPEPYISPEPWQFESSSSSIQPLQSGPIKIPSGQFWVMGDNRNHSSDSRTFDTISQSSIQARAWIRIWPLNRFGFISTGPKLFAQSTPTSPKATTAPA